MDRLVDRAVTRLPMFAMLTLATLTFAACSSSSGSPQKTRSTAVTTKVPGATSSAPPTAAAATAPASSGSGTIAVKCPSAAVVGAAVGHAETGPVTENNAVGGQSTTVCGYRISKSNGDLTSVSFITFSVAAAESAAKAQWAAKETSVPGLGDAAYANPSAGALIVFVGSVMLSINSPGSTSAQLEGLARTLLAA
jgi:hypothetical protein